jgi:hypothetical protein
MMECKQRFNLGVIDKMLLDAAHDAEAVYMLLDHQNIEPFIDLNNRSKKNTTTESDIHISPTGIPICPKGNEMKPTRDYIHSFLIPITKLLSSSIHEPLTVPA